MSARIVQISQQATGCHLEYCEFDKIVRWVPDWRFQNWTIIVDNGGVRGEYSLNLSEDEIPPLYTTEEIVAFVESKLPESVLLGESALLES